jgi:FkbM family methyltransferase
MAHPTPYLAPPAEFTLEQRIEMTASARDADVIPKVEGAGAVFTDETGARVQRMHNGLKVVADGYCGAWMTQLIGHCRGHHEPQEELAFYSVLDRLPNDAVMIEIGGSWSYYSMWFLNGRPGRRALVIEPDRNGVALAHRNLALNGLQAEVLWGYVGQSYAALANSEPMPPPPLSVPDLLQERGLGFLDILHCDAQGAEIEMIESCATLFREGRVGWLFVSTHGATITGDPLTHQKCLARLIDLGAEIVAEHDVYESFSGDGLIVAHFGSPAAEPGFPELSRNRYSRSYYRNPLYDLAEANASRIANADVVELVAQAYAALHRQPAPSEEIAAAVDRFSHGETAVADLAERFFQAPAVAPDAPANFPTETVGLWLELRRDSALGVKGERVLSPVDEVLTPYLIAHGQWQTEPLDLARAHLDPAGAYTLVDIGANIGMFSRQFLTGFAGIRRCLCVEPDPRNLEALAVNLQKFRDVDLRLFPVALGASNAAATFFRDADNIGNYSLHRDAMRDRKFDEVEVRTIDAQTWASEHLAGTERIILKTDTQGSDEAIAVRIPLPIWRNVVFACLEIWRIEKPAFDAAAFKAIVESFSNWSFRGARNCPVAEILDYSAGKDWRFHDLYMWR